jgi:hypothetical protein
VKKRRKSRTLAMTVRCPNCGALPGRRCWRDKATEQRGALRIACHAERHEEATPQ